MCGRFTQTYPLIVLQQHFSCKTSLNSLDSNYNIAPGQYTPIIIKNHCGRYLLNILWGLTPSWSNQKTSNYKMINIRSESFPVKPYLKKLLKHKRCLVPADGFYEWQHTSSGDKIPYRFFLKSEKLFSMAGIWEEWESSEGEILQSFAIITLEANGLIRPIHERMPAILDPKDESKWLDPHNTQEKKLLSLLKPHSCEDMHLFQVSKQVNSTSNNSPYLVQAV
jgi:putative SOS response-associated peptidase YedK